MSKIRLKKNGGSSGDLSQLFRIYDFMVRQDLNELNWEEKEFKIIIRREFGSGVSFRHHGKESRSRAVEKETLATAEHLEQNTITINSPIIGVFYSLPSPGALPFVEEGAIVSAGRTVCIVEAMKLMNEIQTEQKCKILKVLVSNGQSVQVNEPLFLILPIED